AGWVRSLTSRAPAPDLTVFLRVRPWVALARRYAASAEREIFEVPAFQRRVHRAYGAALAGIVAEGQRVADLDGERAPDAVAAEVAGAVGKLLR
ncbi:MAG TPA: dTMP kinase, partial [Anaeromyxobacteraceae bacterium]|nr:dTMP kinase [Anaeromyxobacteraceae bacterium]